MANNKIRKTAAKIAAAVLTAALAVQAVMPVTEAQAATSTANKMFEIPVSFQTDRVCTSGLDAFGSYAGVAETQVWGLLSSGATFFTCGGADYTPDSRIEYKVYIPAEYFANEDSMLLCEFNTIVYHDGENGKTRVSGYLWSTNATEVAVSPDGVQLCATLDGTDEDYGPHPAEEVAEMYSDTDFEAQIEQEGSYYVLSVNMKAAYESGSIKDYDDSVADEEAVWVSLQPRFYGFSMDAADGDIYLDDVKISTASGKELFSLDFEDIEEGEDIAVAIIYDGSGHKTENRELGVKSVDTSGTTEDMSDTSAEIGDTAAEPSISATTATIAAGYTTKLSVTDGTVISWKSSKKSVATVDKNGKVTGVKAGKATITATLEDGTKLSCKVTVKANKYTETKLTTSDVKSGKSDMQVYSAYYDDNGNLKIKVNVVNNTSSDFVKMENIKIVVKNSAGKTIGTYTKSSKTVPIESGSTKTMTFTIKKSALKKTSANMTKAEVTTCKAAFK